MADIMQTSNLNGQRKEDHLDISLNYDIGFNSISTGLEGYTFVHQALPELDLKRIDTSTTLLGKKVQAPLVIDAMVGGIDAAVSINKNLAKAAQTLGLAMGVGSQRCMIDDPAMTYTYAVRDVAPDILLFANIGAIQLNNGYGIRECLTAVESIEADALVLHLNPLQEALQMEGDTNFAGLVDKIGMVCQELPVPVIVKEVGWGISENAAVKLVKAGVAGIDTAGAGGTSWSQVEGIRSGKDSISSVFDTWGIPLVDSLRMVCHGAPGVAKIASGGIRTGIDIAKVIALGADVAGIAVPLLKPASESAEAVTEVLGEIIEVLKISMFCTGTRDINRLKHSPFLVSKNGGLHNVIS